MRKGRVYVLNYEYLNMETDSRNIDFGLEPHALSLDLNMKSLERKVRIGKKNVVGKNSTLAAGDMKLNYLKTRSSASSFFNAVFSM